MMVVNPAEDMNNALQQGGSGSLDGRATSSDGTSGTTGVEGSNPRQKGARRRNRNRKPRKRKSRAAPMKVVKFKGKTSEMSGHVFRTQKESSTPRQEFKKTMEQLEHWVGLKTKFQEDLRPIFGNEIKRPGIDVPVDLTKEDKKSAARVRIWEKGVDMTAKREMALEMSLKQLYAMVWWQCSKVMHTQI